MFTAATVFLTACLAVVGSANPMEKRQLAQVVTKCTVPKTAALTFDDGPFIYLNEIVDALGAANATGTFFFNGNNFGCIYDPEDAARVKYAYDRGHQIASHTWGHLDLSTLSWDQIHDEMWRVEQALTKIAGVVPAFMRPPYGNYNDLVLQASQIRGQKIAIWDFDSEDSLGATPAQSKGYYDSIIGSHPSNILALNHEVYKTTAQQVVPYAISKLKAAGYKIVSLAECVGQPAYQSIGAPGVRDSTWQC